MELFEPEGVLSQPRIICCSLGNPKAPGAWEILTIIAKIRYDIRDIHTHATYIYHFININMNIKIHKTIYPITPSLIRHLLFFINFDCARSSLNRSVTPPWCPHLLCYFFISACLGAVVIAVFSPFSPNLYVVLRLFSLLLNRSAVVLSWYLCAYSARSSLFLLLTFSPVSISSSFPPYLLKRTHIPFS